MENNIFDMYGILAVIKNKDGITIDALSRKTDMPAGTLKKNLHSMYKYKRMFSPFNELKVDIDDDEEDCTAYIDSIIDDEYNMVSLNRNEKNLFDTIMAQNHKGRLKDIEYKNTYGIAMDSGLLTKLICIDAAIKRCGVLLVKYKGKNNSELDMLIEPLGIVFYEFENLFYIIGQYEGNVCIYRMDRIIKVKDNIVGKKSFIRMGNFSMEKYLENMWGMEFGDEVKVKVKFLKEANVEYKVKRDIEYRKNKSIYERDEYFIYEDTIIGINNFKSWLRSFGSSAIVLEPKQLRDDIIESAQKMYKYYGGEV